MKSKSDLILFIAEAFARWGNRSPKYMRVWKTVNAIISALAFLPLILSGLDIIATGKWANIILAAVSFSGAYGVAMNSLVVSKPAEVEMPFTDKKNAETK